MSCVFNYLLLPSNRRRPAAAQCTRPMRPVARSTIPARFQAHIVLLLTQSHQSYRPKTNPTHINGPPHPPRVKTQPRPHHHHHCPPLRSPQWTAAGRASQPRPRTQRWPRPEWRTQPARL